jgi:hypothetical protein
MAIEKTIKLNVETGAAQKNTEDLTNVLKEQRAILIELEREYLEASRVLNETSKSDFSGRKKATEQVKHLRDSIKDQRLSVRELSNEQTNLNKTAAKSTKHHIEQGKALHLLDKVTFGYLSESIHLYEEASHGLKVLDDVGGKWNIKQKLITAGQYIWNLAISLNPIGLIIAAIVALIAMGAALFSFFSSAAAATAKHTAAVDANEKAMKKQTVALEKKAEEAERAANQELAMAKASGASAEAIRKLELKLIDEKIARERSTKATLLDTYETNKNSLAKLRAAGADEDIIKRQLEITAESGKNILKQNDNIKAALNEKKDIQNRHLVEIKTAEVQANNEAKERAKEASDNARSKQKEAAEKSRATQKEINAQKEKDDEAARLKKIADDEKYEIEKAKIEAEANAKRIAVEDAQFKLSEELTYSEQEKEVAALVASYEAKFLIASDNAELEKQLKEKQKQEIDAINQKYADKEIADEEAKAKKKKEIQIQGVANGLSIISDLTELFAGKSQAQQKKAFKIQKAINIATAVLDTYKAANVALASAPPPFNFIAMGAAITAGLVNVKKISETEFNGGGASSGGASGGANASVPQSTQQAPQFNVVGNSGINQLAQIQQQPTQAYVVSGAVTSAQSLDRNRIQNATIG